MLVIFAHLSPPAALASAAHSCPLVDLLTVHWPSPAHSSLLQGLATPLLLLFASPLHYCPPLPSLYRTWLSSASFFGYLPPRCHDGDLRVSSSTVVLRGSLETSPKWRVGFMEELVITLVKESSTSQFASRAYGVFQKDKILCNTVSAVKVDCSVKRQEFEWSEGFAPRYYL